MLKIIIEFGIFLELIQCIVFDFRIKEIFINYKSKFVHIANIGIKRKKILYLNIDSFSEWLGSKLRQCIHIYCYQVVFRNYCHSRFETKLSWIFIIFMIMDGHFNEDRLQILYCISVNI